jgi:ubiquinone/menaquinone biosynthesis C-methylase UbiE
MTIHVDKQDKYVEKIFWDGQSQDARYSSYEKKVYSAFRVPEYIEMIRLVNAKYPLLAGSSIVDIGCSAGVSSITLATLDFKVTGLDISEGLISQAKELAINENSSAQFLTGDAVRLPFERESVDVCFMVGLLHHFPNYAPVIDDIYRILKPGGVVVAIEPNALNIAYRTSFKLVHMKNGVTPNEHPLSPFRIRREFSQIFDEVSIIPFRSSDVPFLRQSGFLGKGILGAGLKAVYLFMRRLFVPKILQGTFFIAIGKKL